MKKKLIKVLRPDLMERFFALVMAMTLVIGGLLYWQGYIKEPGLILLGVFVLVAGVAFALGVRTAQTDGFLDGYIRAKDDLDGKKS